MSKDPVFGSFTKAEDTREIRGIQVRTYLDCLGMRISTTKAETLKSAEKACKRRIMSMEGQFRCLDQRLN